LLVGYFVLGPSDLFKLTKEIGKFVQNVRTFSDEATSTFENNMESQLQLEEIRKAQRELNDAFNFRRSINVDAESEAFEVNAQSPRPDPIATVPDEEISADAQPKKKVRRRRVKKKKVEEEEEPPFCVGDTDGEVANNVPDLSMDEEMSEEERRMVDSLKEAKEELRKEQMEIEAAELRNERMERLQSGSQPDESMESLMAEEELASAEGYDASLLSDENAQSRFQAQLNNNWNEQILSKEDELSPLSDIMERLALLEEEKNAADNRLQEEFRLREENEEKFYREKRMLLQEAAAKIQADAYATTGPANSENV
jgi:Sec-independent protein translocase protein TatA